MKTPLRCMISGTRRTKVIHALRLIQVVTPVGAKYVVGPKAQCDSRIPANQRNFLSSNHCQNCP